MSSLLNKFTASNNILRRQNDVHVNNETSIGLIAKVFSLDCIVYRHNTVLNCSLQYAKCAFLNVFISMMQTLLSYFCHQTLVGTSRDD